MAKLVVLYKTPKDPAAFHLPDLICPNLTEQEISPARRATVSLTVVGLTSGRGHSMQLDDYYGVVN